MSGVVLIPPRFQFLDAVGNPLANGLVDVYLAGSTTRTSTWTDRDQTSLNANPIVLDANGSCTMVVDDTLTYKLVVKNFLGTVQPHAGGDNISGGTGGTTTLATYTTLRAYAGSAKSVYVTGYSASAAPSAIAGEFVRDDIDVSSADDAGTIIVASTGKRWKRVFSGPIDAAWFTGFDATGVTDSSAAVAAAIAALPTGGGTVIIPRGTPRFNVTITKQGVTLKGPGMGRDRSWGSGANYVRPWTDASPCIQVGNGALVTGVSIEDMTVYGATTGTIGIYWAEGAFRCDMRNVSVYEFTTNNIKYKGGATFPCSLIFGYNIVSQSTVAGNDGVLIDGNVATYTSAIYLIGAHLSVNGAGSHAIAVDSCDSVFLSNVYVDAADLKGVVMRKTGALVPRILANGFTLDSDLNTDVLLEVYNTSTRPADFIRGRWTLDGKMKNSAATTVGPFTGSSALEYTPLVYGPMIDGNLTFPDATASDYYTDLTAAIFGSGASGARNLNLLGRRVDLTPGAANVVRVNSPSGSATASLNLLDQVNGLSTFVNNAAGEAQVFSSGSGKAVRLGDGTWNGQPLRFGSFHAWFDTFSMMRMHTGAPSSATDGTPLGKKVTVPALVNTAGAPGQWAADTSNFYVYTGDGTTHSWRRVAVAAF